MNFDKGSIAGKQIIQRVDGKYITYEFEKGEKIGPTTFLKEIPAEFEDFDKNDDLILKLET